VWWPFRWFFSKPTVKAILGAAILGGTALWFWSWPGLLVACLFVWLFSLFRQNQMSRSSESETGHQKTPAATPMSSSESEQEKYEREQEYERQQAQKDERLIADTHKRSTFKHIPGQPWGDPSSYVKASTHKELKQAQEALDEREVEIREHEEALKRQKADSCERDEAREREAREFLSREADRVLKEREEQREAAQKREREAEPNRPPWLH